MTAKQASERLIAAEERVAYQTRLAFAILVLSLFGLVGYCAGYQSLGPGMAIWMLGGIATIIGFFALDGKAGSRTVRMMLAVALAFSMAGPVAQATAKVLSSPYFTSKVRVKQPDGSWKLVPQRIAAPYMRY